VSLDTPSSFEPDAVLLGAVDFARAALDEITPAETVGDYVGHTVHDEHVLSLKFESLMPGYPDWNWTVTLSRTDADAQPNVLETELMPGEGSVLSPEWVPWSLRLEEYEAEHDGSVPLDDDDDDDDEGLDDEGIDLDDHIIDDDVLADGDLDAVGGDGDFDDSVDADAPVDASVLISAANATPPARRGRGARRQSEVDVKADGLSIVTPDDRAPSSVYFDEEAADLDDLGEGK
jgi:hypothetical protein